jgi:hypothetical protein
MWILKNFSWRNNSPHNKKSPDSKVRHEGAIGYSELDESQRQPFGEDAVADTRFTN